MKVKSVQEYASGGYTYTKYGTLTCFSVCGQTIYPSAATVCPLVNAVDEIVGNSPHFSVSPNPANHQVTIQVDESMAKDFVSVSHITGQTVMLFQLTGTQTTLSTQNLPDGIYLVTLQHQGQRGTQKLVVGH